MSSLPSIEPFRGSGTWEECEDFIRAIRTAAWKEGKPRDDGWMADFAALHFSRKALLWYSQLPEDVRLSWSRLQTNLLTRWAPSEDDDNAKIEPTPAAAPLSSPSAKVDFSRPGTLKLVTEKSNHEYYVEFSDNAAICSLTTDVNKALRVRCSPLSNGTLLERIDHSSQSWLAIHWGKSEPNMGGGPTESAGHFTTIRHLLTTDNLSSFACMSFVDSDTMTSSWTNGHPWQLIKCVVAVNGEASLVWKDGSRKIPLCFFVSSSTPYLVPDPEAYSKAFTGEKRAKLFIQPTD